ncbi:MAG: HAMP domain-containing protein [Geobacteraceae bacterium]|nr:HAMP domain-containing protein [Geobacteraceae bacterium]
MNLNAKLVIFMLTLLVLAMMTLFTLNQISQNKLVSEIQESSTAISDILQKSVEDLTSEAEVETSQLAEYIKEARQKGVNEINIINTEGEIIDSSDPEKIGKKRELKKIEKGLKAAPGKRGSGLTSLKPYNLVVPVIVGDQQLGYVEIDLLLDNIREIQHDNFVRRLVATCVIFGLGTLLIIFLARRYTHPIQRLVLDVRKVAAGDLSVNAPVESSDEIGELAESFNEMVAQLRERKNLEERLHEAEHLSRVGQLASGIAHEIRNPLNYISLAIDHLKDEMKSAAPEKREEIDKISDTIKEEVRKANYMVLNFMNYGRPLKLRRSGVSYRDLLARALIVLKDKLREQKVTVTIDIPADLPPLYCDQELMRNCLFNFITNGAQSMPDGGEITIGASCSEGLFNLTFSDRGTGISAEDMEKIFQPYFTTKEAGIGLGLAITERIIKEHGGRILVESSPGKGTTFTVTLPQSV